MREGAVGLREAEEEEEEKGMLVRFSCLFRFEDCSEACFANVTSPNPRGKNSKKR